MCHATLLDKGCVTGEGKQYVLHKCVDMLQVVLWDKRDVYMIAKHTHIFHGQNKRLGPSQTNNAPLF